MKQNFTIFFSFFCKSNDKVVVDLVEHMHIYLNALRYLQQLKPATMILFK